MLKPGKAHCTIIKLTAVNDTNGNPRRLFVVLPHEKPWQWIAYDEGYSGEAAVPPGLIEENHANFGPVFNITPGEYRGILKSEHMTKRFAS